LGEYYDNRKRRIGKHATLALPAHSFQQEAIRKVVDSRIASCLSATVSFIRRALIKGGVPKSNLLGDLHPSALKKATGLADRFFTRAVFNQRRTRVINQRRTRVNFNP
jgi:hypothetical protein